MTLDNVSIQLLYEFMESLLLSSVITLCLRQEQQKLRKRKLFSLTLGCVVIQQKHFRDPSNSTCLEKSKRHIISSIYVMSQSVFSISFILNPIHDSAEKEQDDHFTRPGTDFSTDDALANQGLELKLLPHSVAEKVFEQVTPSHWLCLR